MASTRNCWTCLVAALFAALIAAPANAAPKSKYVKVETAYRDPGSRTMYGDFIAKTEFPTSNLPSVYNNVKLPISPRTVGKMAKTALGGPVGAALSAALLLDDLIAQKNPQTGEWEVTKQTVLDGDCESMSILSGILDLHAMYGTSTVTCEFSQSPGKFGGYWTATSSATCHDTTPLPFTGGNVHSHSMNDGTGLKLCKAVQWLSDPTAPSPATDLEVYDAFLDNLKSYMWKRALEDFLLNRKHEYMDDELSELRQALKQLEQAHQNAIDNNLTLDSDIEIVTNSNTETTNNYSTELTEIQKTLNQIANNTTNLNVTVEMDAGKFDIPTDCDFSPTLCAFLDWFKTTDPLPEHPDIPVEDIVEQGFNSGLGEGSCPSPVQFHFQGAQLEYSYQPACDAAPWFRAILLMIASLASAYILLGVRQNA